MSKLILYFFAIIFLFILFNLISGGPTQIMNTKNIPRAQLISATDYEEEEEGEEETDEDDDTSDLLYDGPIDTKRPALPGLKSNGMWVVSMRLDSLLFIGFLFSVCSF